MYLLKKNIKAVVVQGMGIKTEATWQVLPTELELLGKSSALHHKSSQVCLLIAVVLGRELTLPVASTDV